MVMDHRIEAKMVQDLSTAIKEGKVEEAKYLAGQLAEKKTVIDMLFEPVDDSKDKIISVNIHIEDKETSTSRPFEWNVKVSTKIGQLKRLMYKEKGFPISVQRWIVEKRIASDSASLSSCGVSEDGHTLFLYLLSRKPRTLQPGLEDGSRPGAASRSQTPINRDSGARSMDITPNPAGNDDVPYATMPAMPARSPEEGAAATGAVSMEVSTGTQSPRPDDNTIQDGWNCPSCTFLNTPIDPLCKICHERKPLEYQDQQEISNVSSQQVQQPEESQRPHISHQPQRPQDSHQPQRPQDSHQPQRPQDSHQALRETHQPQIPPGTSSGDRRSPVMVYDFDKMTYVYAQSSYGHDETSGV